MGEYVGYSLIESQQHALLGKSTLNQFDILDPCEPFPWHSFGIEAGGPQILSQFRR
jgi:hypothetical protein